MRTHRIVLSAALCVPAVLAAPALEENQQIAFGSSFESLTFGLTSKLSSVITRVLDVATASSASNLDSQDKTIWEIINEEEEFSQLAHIANYSSDSIKDIFKKKKNLTFFAPLNWHHHREGRRGDDHDHEEAYADSSFGPASVQHWKGIQKQIADFENDYPAQTLSGKDDKDDDGEKKRRRAIIRHLIDSELLYHLVRSDEPLDARTIADNSSVATWLNTGSAHKNNDGTDWRIRTGKSLLPLPAVYLNFYSRVVKPDVKAKNGIVHGIKYPLILPPDVLQSLFFGQTTFSTSTSAVQKVHSARYLAYRPYHHHYHHHHGGKNGDKKKNNAFDAFHHEGGKSNFSGVPAETFFAPTNLAWSRLPFVFRAYLFSPFGYHLLQKVLMLHSLPSDIVYADFVHHIKHSHKSNDVVPQATTLMVNGANKTSYTFDTVLPAIHGKKGEFETVDVDVYRYYILPGQKGPLQTRVVVQNVSVILQDIPASNGVYHAIDRFIKPKGHPHKGIWAEIAQQAEINGFGTLDLEAEAAADLW